MIIFRHGRENFWFYQEFHSPRLTREWNFLAKVTFSAKSGDFFEKMIHPEKNRAAERFMDGLRLQRGIVDSINNNPTLLRDRGFKDGGVKTIVSLYKSTLYLLGLRPSVIAERAAGLAENLSKAGRKTLTRRIKEFSGLTEVLANDNHDNDSKSQESNPQTVTEQVLESGVVHYLTNSVHP